MNGDEAMLRRLTKFDAWALALGCIVGWGSFAMPGTTFLPTAGPLGAGMALVLAGGIMALIALNFHFMVNRHPVNGGSYIFARESFGRGHGFVCAWAMVLAYVSIIPLNATALGLISRNLLNSALETGLSYNVLGYDTYLPELLLMATVLAIIGYLVIRNGKTVGVLQNVLVLCLVGGVCIIGAAAIGSPQATMENLQPGFSPGTSPVAAVLGIAAIAPFIYVGFDAVAQVSGETAFSPRKTGAIMVSAIAVGAVLYIVLDTVAASVVPGGYDSWAGYIAATPRLSGIESIPLFNAVTTMLGPAGIIVVSIATLGAVLTGIIGFYLASSRLLHVMAQQGALPERFARLHGKYHSPTNAILLVGGIAIVAACFGRTILNWIVDVSAVGSAIGFLYTCAAVMRIAGREGKPGWKAVGMAGTIASAAFIVLLLVPNPLIGNALNIESYVFLFAWMALGFNFYTPEYREKATKLEKRVGETEIES